MKKIGLIGGLSCESTKYYYEVFNSAVKHKLGRSNSCKCLINSVNYQEVADLQHAEEWNRLNDMMADAAQALEKGGADIILLGTNTMHLCADAITDAIDVPFLHIADTTGEAIQKKGLDTILLLGTRFTMQKEFYSSRLKRTFDIDTLVPDDDDMTIVHDIIYEELVNGLFAENSRQKYQQVISKMKAKGAQGVVLGCTEIPLLIREKDTTIPSFDTAKIHALKAVEIALGDNKY